MRGIVTGLGTYVPEKVLTNADLEKIVDTNDEWITTRTGIKQRHIVEDNSGVNASELGAKAANKALEDAGVEASNVDAILVGSIHPDKQFPATACLIQEKIGAKNAFAYDITAACAGFVFCMNSASLLIQSGQCKHVLVIGTEIMSRVVDWNDRNTCVLFGDGAGAILLSAYEGNEERGVLSSKLASNGSAADTLYLNSGLSTSESPKMVMQGKQVFKHAVECLSSSINQALAQQNYKVDDLDLIVPHQANIRILNAVGDRLKLDKEKVYINVQRYGNTSAASIPLALYEARAEGRLKPGMLVGLAAIGGGLSWGCNLVRW